VTIAKLNALRPKWMRVADELVAKLVARGSFDAVADLAEVFPLQVFPDAVGIQSEGRENLLPYANLTFNAFGPRNNLLERAAAQAKSAVEWVTRSCKREALSPGGWRYSLPWMPAISVKKKLNG